MRLTDKRHLTVYLAEVDDAVDEIQRLALDPPARPRAALRSERFDDSPSARGASLTARVSNRGALGVGFQGELQGGWK